MEEKELLMSLVRLCLTTQVPKDIDLAGRTKRPVLKVGNIQIRFVKTYVDVTKRGDIVRSNQLVFKSIVPGQFNFFFHGIQFTIQLFVNNFIENRAVNRSRLYTQGFKIFSPH